MSYPGSLAVTEIPGVDPYGRRVAVQRMKGSGPVRAGDVYAVLVDVPRAPINGRRMVDVVTAGTIECETPARGSKRGTWTMRQTNGTNDTIREATRNDAALTLAGWVPSAEETTAQAEAAQLAGEAADTAAAVDELAGAFLAALDAAARAEHIGDAQTEGAARLEADRIAEALDALGACPCQLPREHPRALAFCTEHGATSAPAGPVPGSFHDPRATCCGRDAADCDCDPAAVQLVALADAMQAARELEEAAEARHAYADARVTELRAALAEAEEERRTAREELHAAINAAAELWTV